MWGCSVVDSDFDPYTMSSSELIDEAQDTLRVGDQRITLETNLWRDFFPFSPSDGQPLIARFRIFSVDSTALPDGFVAEVAWLVNENDDWEANFTNEDIPSFEDKPYQLFETARNGPKWDPGDGIDVVVLLRNESNRPYLIRSLNQTIVATY